MNCKSEIRMEQQENDSNEMLDATGDNGRLNGDVDEDADVGADAGGPNSDFGKRGQDDEMDRIGAECDRAPAEFEVGLFSFI